MPDHDRLQRTAHVQWGYFTSQQAADHGFSRQLCNHHCRRGSWTRVARGIFRMHGVPERPDEDLAFITLLASDARGRPVGVVSHDSALHVHGLLRRRPATVHLSLPPGIHMSLPSHVTAYRRRIDLPWSVAGQPPGAAPRYAEPFDVGAYREGLRAASPRRPGRWNVWAEPWRPRAAASGSEGLHEWRRPPLVAEEIEDRGAFRLTAPLRSVLDCLSWGTAADLTEALQRASRAERSVWTMCWRHWTACRSSRRHGGTSRPSPPCATVRSPSNAR